MTDKYVFIQMKFYESADSKSAENNALYRIGTYLELESVPCNGNADLTPEQRTIILDAVKGEGSKE